MLSGVALPRESSWNNHDSLYPNGLNENSGNKLPIANKTNGKAYCQPPSPICKTGEGIFETARRSPKNTFTIKRIQKNAVSHVANKTNTGTIISTPFPADQSKACIKIPSFDG